MKLKKFIGKKIHGYLDFNVSFFNDVNFLTGINGSGKTSIINSISALISPSFLLLANNEYELIQVVIENEFEELIIESRKNLDNSSFILTCNMVSEELIVSIISRQEIEVIADYKVKEELVRYYKEQETFFSKHPVLKIISNLPSPIMLDVDRRSEGNIIDRRPSMARRRRANNLFGPSLSKNFSEACDLAEYNFRKIQANQVELTNKLRKDIIISSIQIDQSQKTKFNKFPDLGDGYFEARKEKIVATLKQMNISESEVSGQLDPFFLKLKELSKKIPSNKDLNDFLNEVDIFRDEKDYLERLNAISDWMRNKDLFDRITKIAHHAEEYLNNIEKIKQPITNYLNLINQFFEDSKKIFRFDNSGNLEIISNQFGTRPVQALSSGENQIFVILTYLTFNPNARKANVFIVDEPELSLHVRWQELFVKALRDASPSLQIILATHSPSIILDDIEHCIDLNK